MIEVGLPVDKMPAQAPAEAPAGEQVEAEKSAEE